MTKFYVDAQGRYVGGFDGAMPPAGAFEVPRAPANAADTWNAGAWHFTPTIEEIREKFKAERAALVAAIVVTIDSLPFDGDEISQGRMARAILALTAAAVPSTTWVLANNEPTEVTLSQLQRALIASGLAQSAVWVAP